MRIVHFGGSFPYPIFLGYIMNWRWKQERISMGLKANLARGKMIGFGNKYQVCQRDRNWLKDIKIQKIFNQR